MQRPIFITGIGTDVGKTIISAIVTEALHAHYWKPVQAGFTDGTDAEKISSLISNKPGIVHDELYRLSTPVSPHIAATADGISIDSENILTTARSIMATAHPAPLVIEGAGGLLVPLAEGFLVGDMISQLNARVILVSRNYLGSINHSLLTAASCKYQNLDVRGWIFNDNYLNYEADIVRWSGYPSIGSVPSLALIDKASVSLQAERLRYSLCEKLGVTQ